jgi:hypothetical protein
MKHFRSAASLALAVVSVLGLAGPAAAGKQVPFKGVFAGERTERIPLGPTTVRDRWDTAGTATHLGRFELVVSVVVDFGSLPVTGTGTATFVAANGDMVFAEITGHSEPVEPGVTVLIIESGVITGGTGRFAGATGSYTSERLTSLITNETVGSFEGTISSPGS